ncbi:hypothetical protein MUK70_01415 [Dyadobacter chenwenxiniae]|uniref:Uncharacterized protein n=1 Tax=Dyadobacter chenwenxiniae TaxID=2906456 RepID=A0A9X1TF07_9BACT|nr:hypothetical protein [Dyadobacter chenwenxiniae]MCF0062592.1 hypothetical protein [Dyadobacter chenwenxiniae]UON83661.1 hypothetical protein MUK70_01415 [Dyadobacter chenwenxiniae]
MNRWFKWLFNAESPAAARAKSEGNVRIADDKVIYSPREGFRETVIDLSKLQYVYLYMTESCQNLVLNDYHQHFIPCSVNGFANFFQHLARRLSLDEKVFYENLNKNKPQKTELWRGDNSNNGRISEQFEPTDLRKALARGFCIHSQPEQQISWDMTSEALAGSAFVYQQKNEYELTELCFRHPVQLGNLILDDWRYYLPIHLRLDVPLDSFYTNLHMDGNGDQNYFLAKKALVAVLGETNEGYERNDQNACYWHFEGLKFSLIYWYDSQHGYESGYAYLAVQNERAYPDYLIDSEYEQNGTISKLMLLDKSFTIGSDFRRSRYFLKTPQLAASMLSPEKQFLIWMDEANGKVGFANKDHAMIFPLAVVTQFQLENVYPGRSGGGTYFSAILQDNDRQSILIGDCNALDPFLNSISELVQLPIIELPPSEA